MQIATHGQQNENGIHYFVDFFVAFFSANMLAIHRAICHSNNNTNKFGNNSNPSKGRLQGTAGSLSNTNKIDTVPLETVPFTIHGRVVGRNKHVVTTREPRFPWNPSSSSDSDCLTKRGLFPALSCGYLSCCTFDILLLYILSTFVSVDGGGKGRLCGFVNVYVTNVFFVFVFAFAFVFFDALGFSKKTWPWFTGGWQKTTQQREGCREP